MFAPQFFFGTVEDREDPLKMGRVRIRVDHIHPQDQNLVPTDALPWSMPMNWLQSAGVSGVGWAPVGLMVGSRVFGFFADGEECQIPFVMGSVAGKVGHLTFPAVTQADASEVAPAEVPVQEAKKKDDKLGPVPQDKNGKAVALANRLIKDFGITKTQAAGVLGNFLVECPNLIPNTNQGGRKGAPIEGKASGKGYGYAQWDNVRRAEMIEFCKKKNLDIQTDEANYQFLAHELRTTEKNALKALKETKSIDEAARVWSSRFERAGKPHMERRISEATQVYKSLNSTDLPVRQVGVEEDAQGNETPETKVPDDLPPQELNVNGTEPLVHYRGRYPYNKTYRSESGHVKEIDDTPGHERLLDYHTTGTYTEVNEEGRHVTKIVSDKYTIVAEDDNVYVTGHVNLFVDGNVNAKIGGDLVAEVGDEVCIRSAGAIRLKGKSINMETTGGDINMKATGNIAQDATGDVTTKTAGKSITSAVGDVSIAAGGKLNADGTEIHWGEGTVAAPAAKGAGMNLALHGEQLSFLLDDDFDGELLKEAVEEGLIKQEELDEPFVASETAPEPKEADKVPPVPPITKPAAKAASGANDKTPISNYFKLGDVSSWAAASRESVRAQRGLSFDEIVQNLSLVAQNCLDPIKKQYPNMVVTSGFRIMTKGTSQHEIGQAIDMQFSGLTNSQYLAVAKWIRDSSGITFDQLILEHKSIKSKRSWIHISFNKSKNRKMVFTMNNHKTVGQGLIGKEDV